MQSDDSLHAHIAEDMLEQYAMSKLTGADLAAVEEHLLVCQQCQNRLAGIDKFISSFRGAVFDLKEQPIDYTHDTDHGPIRLCVQASQERGKWAALLSGHAIERAERFRDIYEANTFLMQSFRELFPDHDCTDKCGPTGGHVSDVT